MDKFRGIALLLLLAALACATLLPCRADEKKEEEKTIFTEDVPRGRRQPGGFELTDKEKNRLLEVVKKIDQKKAREIAGLRKEDPKKFIEELKKNAREEYARIVGERVEKWIESRRQESQAAFKEWLKKNVPQLAEELEKLKGKDPDLYARKYDWAYEKYKRVFDESRYHPEEAKVLLEDLKLQDRRDYLIRKYKNTRSEKDKKRIVAQLERVLSDRYDLIVIRRQMGYERLLRRLESLQNYIKKSRDEIEEAKKKDIKDENIKKRMKTLLEGKKKGILDD